MSKVYSTAELIKILEAERQACLQGQRLKLAATPSTGNPVIDRFLKSDGVQKFTAYQDFKAAVHRYQEEHQVSGIVWREITLHGDTLCYPAVDDQLIALPIDLKVLKQAKASILEFWQRVTVEMDLYLSINSGKDYREIGAEDVDAIVQRTEWAAIWKWEKLDFLEMLLQLGWGKPEEAYYKRGWPISGSEYIHAVKPGQRPIC
ncbi:MULTISPECIES: hypothetical protein [Kamptonema]|uniref:hypothetical protein n=1 Tax=Kamptonema TaxID=1501433 RepID=UPI0001DAC436|nr:MULTISPECIES: hypothetical protein [Kamptonema]CBN56702.1 conserved hypothetical protein [Kamptonema sp. PCC 6506]